MRASENAECVAQVASRDAMRRDAFAFILGRTKVKLPAGLALIPLARLPTLPLSLQCCVRVSGILKNIVACFQACASLMR